MEKYFNQPVTFLIDGGIYLLAGFAVAVLAVLFVCIKTALSKKFTKVQGIALAFAAVAALSGFICSFRMINYRPCDLSSAVKISAAEEETDVTAVKINCFLFDCIYEYTVAEENSETVITYYNAKKKHTAERYISECLEVHRSCGDTITYGDGIITAVSPAGDYAWVYATHGDRLEIIVTCSGDETEKYASWAYDDVRKGER